MEENKQAHHILPLQVYLGVGTALLILTIVTVWVAQYNLGPVNLLVAMIIAAAKASLVALYFMHLKYDNKLYAVIFLTALLFLAAFIVFTMFDTMDRGLVDPTKERPISDKAVIYQQQEAETAAPAGTEAPAADSSAADENPGHP